jgi:hypothetical protein
MNCLGVTDDLTAALQDYEAGLIDVTLDSVHRDGAIDDFFRRTYVATDRLGKVVYEYASGPERGVDARGTQR